MQRCTCTSSVQRWALCRKTKSHFQLGSVIVIDYALINVSTCTARGWKKNSKLENRRASPASIPETHSGVCVSRQANQRKCVGILAIFASNSVAAAADDEITDHQHVNLQVERQPMARTTEAKKCGTYNRIQSAGGVSCRSQTKNCPKLHTVCVALIVDGANFKRTNGRNNYMQPNGITTIARQDETDESDTCSTN